MGRIDAGLLNKRCFPAFAKEYFLPDQTPMDFSSATPPEAFSPPMKALWWLKKGDLRPGQAWEQAHNICQSAEGDMAHDWIHGLCHLIEGDHGNASYWFRGTGKSLKGRDVTTLWEEMVETLR